MQEKLSGLLRLQARSIRAGMDAAGCQTASDWREAREREAEYDTAREAFEREFCGL